MSHAETMRKVRAAIREGYAWPGGYHIIISNNDGDHCADCAREFYRDISLANRPNMYYAHQGSEVFISIGDNETDTPCVHCGKQLSAYYEPGPEDGDYTITPAGHLGSTYAVAQHGGEFLFSNPDMEACKAEIRWRMDAEKYWPNVWFISDHGNVTPVSLD